MTAIVPSKHLTDETWLKRGNPAESPLNAWERAVELDVEKAANGPGAIPHHDEARYDTETQTVIFRVNHTLITCYSVRPEFVTNGAGRAVREAVANTFGADEVIR